MSRPELLFERLITSVPWRSERRRMYDRTVDVPRLLAFYDEGDELPDPSLDEGRRILASHYGGRSCGAPSTTGLALYRDGNDSVAWHGDTLGRDSDSDTLVAVMSLGERRRFLLRRSGGGAARRFDLAAGDLLVMGGSCQRTWQHSVPKSVRVGAARISVQYRSAGVR